MKPSRYEDVIFLKDKKTLELVNRLAKALGFRPTDVVRIAIRFYAKRRGIDAKPTIKSVNTILISDRFYVNLVNELREKMQMIHKSEVVRLALSEFADALEKGEVKI